MMRYPAILIIALLAVAADYATKRWIEANLDLHEFLPLLPNLAFFHTRNTGIAFSMLDWLEGPWLLVLPLAIVVFVAYLAWRTPATHAVARTGFALILGGAVGNLIDRAMLGHVVDYVLFYVGDWSFAVFNLADAFISVGAGLIILQELLVWRSRPRKA